MQKWEKFWKLTAVWESKKMSSWMFEKCICECWNIKRISRSHLRKWATKSCWCLRNELSKNRLNSLIYKHWYYWTHIYKKYMAAKSRCENENNPSYSNYWWRWIKFLWDNFEDFYKDMWKSYEEHINKFWKDDTTLDRIDVNWDYCKENCRRQTNIEQQNNRRNNIKIIYKWKEYKSIQEVCNEFWLKHHQLRRRLVNWWSIEKAIETPVIKRNYL